MEFIEDCMSIVRYLAVLGLIHSTVYVVSRFEEGEQSSKVSSPQKNFLRTS